MSKRFRNCIDDVKNNSCWKQNKFDAIISKQRTKKKIIVKKKIRFSKKNFWNSVFSKKALAFRLLNSHTKSFVQKNFQNIDVVLFLREEFWHDNNHVWRKNKIIVANVFFKLRINKIKRHTIIRIHIARFKFDNVFESNGISNKILKAFIFQFFFLLIVLFRACATLNHHSQCFRKAHIIAIKKFNKKDYTLIKAYRSIAVLNALEKTLKSIIARRITTLIKEHHMLSNM